MARCLALASATCRRWGFVLLSHSHTHTHTRAFTHTLIHTRPAVSSLAGACALLRVYSDGDAQALCPAVRPPSEGVAGARRVPARSLGYYRACGPEGGRPLGRPEAPRYARERRPQVWRMARGVPWPNVALEHPGARSLVHRGSAAQAHVVDSGRGSNRDGRFEVPGSLDTKPAAVLCSQP